MQKPILVTGSHRSGSTWTGQMIAASKEVGYIHEPFNIITRPTANNRINLHTLENWFQYVCPANESEYDQIVSDAIEFRYNLFPFIGFIKTPVDALHVIVNYLTFRHYREKRVRPLIKDPIAIFSAEWLYQRYNLDVLVLIRHPAAFVSSIKIKNWNFEFRHFVNQPLLMHGILTPFEREIIDYAENPPDVINQAILLWNCIHYVILQYKRNHPDWIFIRHEDLSRSPIDGFSKIYRMLGLDFSDHAKKIIMKSSNEGNPVERSHGDEFKRNSRELISTWKTRLNKNQIAKVRDKTQHIACQFYSDLEW